jgi:hypothetical protein
MPTDGRLLPNGSPEQRINILLADYQACREDDRIMYATIAAVMGVLVTIIGLMVAAVTQTCEFSTSRSCIEAPDYVLAASPMIPIALLAYSTYVMVVGTLRTYYMRGLENELRAYGASPIASLGDVMPASYMGIVQEVISVRRGRATYRLLVNLVLFVVILIFGGYTAYVAAHMAVTYQIIMSIVYAGIAMLLVWQVAQGTVGGRSFFMRAARDFLDNRSGTTLPQVWAGTDSSIPARRESLAAYLIFPRPEDWIKWLIAPGVFLAVAWSFGYLSRWRTFAELWLVLEYLIYQARYQWNDVRGVDEDLKHGERRARRRLPGGSPHRIRRNVLISLAVAAVRLILAAVIGAAVGELGPVLVLMALVLLIGSMYEGLRSRPGPSVPSGNRPTPTIIGIWSAVGLGYGIRAGLGLIAGGLSITAPLAWIGIFSFVALGIMFVTFTWVLEAASSCYKQSGVWTVKANAVLKPHLRALLGYVPITLAGQGEISYSLEEDGGVLAILKGRAQVKSPWNLALTVSSALGGALGVGLAHAASSYLAEVIAVSVSVLGAALLCRAQSQSARLALSVGTALVLTGSIGAFGQWPVCVLVAAPWLTVSLLYYVFRGSSYRDLKEFGPRVLMAIASVRIVIKLWPGLLHVLVGDKTWIAAGFAGSRDTSDAWPGASAPEATSRILMPPDPGGSDAVAQHGSGESTDG